MKLILHDLDPAAEAQVLTPHTQSGGCAVVRDNGAISPCIGCFGCWIKTPGRCVIDDGYADMGGLIAACDELIIVTACTYGSYSPFVKNVLDRSISYVHPHLVIIDDEMHHKPRYKDHHMKLSVHVYGAPSEAMRATARSLVQANAVNFHCRASEVHFYDDVLDLKGVAL